MNARELTEKLSGTWHGNYGSAKCRSHDDEKPSLTIRNGSKGGLLLKCHAGCSLDKVRTALIRDGLLKEKRWGAPHSAETGATAQRSGLTLEQFAAAKKLPLEFLEELEIRDSKFGGRPAIEFPYLSESGVELAKRFRLSINGPDKFRWKGGTKVCLFGLDRLSSSEERGHIAIVEGESDAMTLWHKNWPAIGLPGAATWNEEKWARLFDPFETIYVVIEPDKGGEAMLAWIAKSQLKDRVRLIRLNGFKDPSAMYLDNPERFDACWQAALDNATSFQEEEARRRKLAQEEAWKACEPIAMIDRILDHFGRTLPSTGFAGDPHCAKLLYLAVVSRLFERPVSVVVKGLSGGGKNFLVKQVLRFFPAEAAYLMTGMSPRGLLYTKQSMVHRMLVLSEAAALNSTMATYLVRSLLSEGFIRYETVVSTSNGPENRVIEFEGPTGLIATTTLVNLDAELETRLVSVSIEDTPEQTAAIFLAQAKQTQANDVDLSSWIALQRWLAFGPTAVLIPYATPLAKLIPPLAVRLRRDFPTLLSLISASALLHRARRAHSSDKRFVLANFDDYAVVRELFVEQIGEAVEATVSKTLRQTVGAVAAAKSRYGISVQDLATALNLHPSSVSRRLNVAVERGYLRNGEVRPGYPASIMLGDPLPDKIDILPIRERLERYCADAGKPKVRRRPILDDEPE